MSRSILLAFAFMLGLICAARADPASRDVFTGYWRQISSNAGQCATCSLTISRDGTRYRVVSSNGWNAEAKQLMSFDVPTYVGGGHWERSPPRIDAHRRVAAEFVVGDGRLHLILRLTRPNGSRWEIKAVFEREMPVA